jgi:acid phosphatase type 7
MKRRDFLKMTGVGAIAVGSVGAKAVDAVVGTTQPAKIRTGPYLQNPAADGMTVMWMTTGPCFGHVEYGPTEQLGQIAMAERDGMHVANTVLHKVRLAGLKPGATYYYRVVCKPTSIYKPYQVEYAADVASEVYSFKTIDPAAERVRFIVYNDIHDKLPVWRQCHSLVANEKADFVFINGDIIDYTQDEKQVVDHFLTPATEMFARTTPMLYTRGNHETRGAHAQSLKQYLDQPGGNYYYGLTWGPARFTVLDTGEDKPDQTAVYAGLADFDAYRSVQQKWLEQEIASEAFRSAPQRVLIHHIPAYYNGKPDDHEWTHGAVDLRKKWWPMLQGKNVACYIGGHTHRYTLKKPDPATGHDFPVVIGGGPKLGIATVMLVEVDRNGVKLKMMRDDGKIVGEV